VKVVLGVVQNEFADSSGKVLVARGQDCLAKPLCELRPGDAGVIVEIVGARLSDEELAGYPADLSTACSHENETFAITCFAYPHLCFVAFPSEP